MNFKISSWAIRHPIPIIVLFLLLAVLGIRAFQALPINADPDMRFPMVNIKVTQTGASADELENTVTRRVEDAVSGMAGVRKKRRTANVLLLWRIIPPLIGDLLWQPHNAPMLNATHFIRFPPLTPPR